MVSELDKLVKNDNAIAGMLLKALGSEGQTYLAAADAILRKPTNQDVVVSLLNTLGDYFLPARQQHSDTQDIFEIISETGALLEENRLPLRSWLKACRY